VVLFRCAPRVHRGDFLFETRATLRFPSAVSTVVEIREAIERLSPSERVALEVLVWPDWDRAECENPPGIREKLAEAAKGCFQPGDRSNIQKILSSLE
jgi:hypothetical protein